MNQRIGGRIIFFCGLVLFSPALSAAAAPAPVAAYSLPEGAQIRTRLSRGDFRRLDAVMFPARFEAHRAPFQVEDQGARLGLIGLRGGWAMTDSPLEHVESDLNVALAGLARQRLAKSKNRPVILDWGCGNGRALAELAEQLKNSPVDLVGVGDIPFSRWWSAPKEITFVLDQAQNLPHYFKPGSLSVVYSHMGLEHLHGKELKDHLRLLGGLLSRDGEIRLAGTFMEKEFPKDFKARRVPGGEGWILKPGKGGR